MIARVRYRSDLIRDAVARSWAVAGSADSSSRATSISRPQTRTSGLTPTPNAAANDAAGLVMSTRVRAPLNASRSLVGHVASGDRHRSSLTT